MITAGSVRGNCDVPQSAQASSWPEARGRQLAAAARAEAGHEQPLGQAQRVEDQRRAGQRRRRPGAAAGRAAGTTRPWPPGPAPGPVMTANQARPSLLPEQHPQPLGRLLRRHPRDPRRRGAARGCRRRPAPGCPGRPTAPRATRRRDGVRAMRSWAPAAMRTCWYSTSADVSLRPVSTHIGAAAGDIAPLVLLPGDPLRAKWIAETFLEDARCYSEVRGMLGYTGTWHGQRGLGPGLGHGPAVAWRSTPTELFREYDVQSIIRVGSAGALTEKVEDPRHRHRLRRLHRLRR